MTLNEKIGYQMRTERLIRRLTLQQIADKMSMAKSTISSYENGKIPITAEKLIEYCDAIGCDMYDLLVKAKSL